MAALLLDHPDTNAEFARIVDELTRRGLLAGGLSAVALVGLAACSSGDHSFSGSASTGPWRFTDDLGRRLSLPRRPVRIASLGDSITAALWSAGLHVVASPLMSGNWSILSAGGVPRHGLTAINAPNGWNLEELAEARPDLIVVGSFDGKTLGLGAQSAQIPKIAPVAGVNQWGPVVDPIMASYDRLGTALGITLQDKSARASYEAAATRLRNAIASRPGLRAAVVFATPGGLAFWPAANAPYEASLRGLGLHVLPSPKTGSLSWELAPPLPADLLLYAGPTTSWPVTNPGWKAMPAVRAGQVCDLGLAVFTYTYSNYAAVYDKIAAAVAGAKADIGPR